MTVWHTLTVVDNSGAVGVGVRWGQFSTAETVFVYREYKLSFLQQLFVLVPNIHMFTLQFTKDVAYLRI